MESKRIKLTHSPFTVLVEGNIGSGKTTFLNYFKQYNNICTLAEPIELWKNCGGYNLLSHLYEDRERWGFTFQSYVQLTMLRQHTFKTDCAIKLMERSIYSARYCFVEKMIRDSVLPAPSASVIDEWFKWATSSAMCDVDLIIYLRASPEVVYKRMRERNRQEEKTVQLEYLHEMHEMHENWLYYKTMFTCPAPVLVVNADLDKSVIVEEYQKVTPSIFNKCLSVPS
uniref:Deoxynucleoside kinase domain-containing protein n=1 Tax=Photinus pyralis TaxID=7054 RepID=A0A1Y1LNC0_PHOPY